MALTLEEIMEKARKKSKTDFTRTVKPAPGKSVWRILPGWNKKEPNRFFHAYGQHFIKDTDGKLKVIVGCQDKTYDHSCEICDAIAELAREVKDDKLRDKVTESKSSQRWLFNAIDVNKNPNEVVILELGNGLFNDILSNLEEDSDLFDVDEGRDIVITREGSGLSTKYSLAVRGKSKSITVDKSILANLHDLDEVVKDDFEKKKDKAMETLGIVANKVLGGSATGALTGPDLADELDDEIPEDFDARAEAAKEIEDADFEDVDDEKPVKSSKKAKAVDDEEFGEDIDDDDIEKMLADLD